LCLLEGRGWKGRGRKEKEGKGQGGRSDPSLGKICKSSTAYGALNNSDFAVTTTTTTNNT